MKEHALTSFSVDDKIAVIGAGTMGAGIAQVAADAGHQVILLDVVEGAANKGIEGIWSGLNKLVERGKKTQLEVDDLVQRITPTNELDDVADCRLIIEAIIENLEIKQQLFADIESRTNEQTIIASNTSSISISALAANAQRPENIVGMHFFNPAAILKLVEVVSGLQTSKEVAQTVYDTAAAWGKKPVHTKSTPGFIVNRVARPFYAEALRSVTEQLASIEVIDTLMRSCGEFKMGPLELMDLIGHDVNCAVTESVYNAFYQDKRFMPSVLQAEMVSAGLLGRKSGKGFHSYPHEKKNVDDSCSTFKKCQNVKIVGNLEHANGLQNCMIDAGYDVCLNAIKSTIKNTIKQSCIEVGSAVIKLSDGRTASQHAAEESIENLVLLDFANDYQSTQDVAITFGVNTSDQAKEEACEFFQSLGKRVHILKDIPGMLVLRTICMLINEAYDAVNQGVCSPKAVDVAMKSGVAYPYGPIAWGEQIGLKRVVKALNNIQSSYREERYRTSPLLSIRIYEN